MTATDPSTPPLYLRWHRDRDYRYYEVFLQQDLLAAWVVTSVWGRRGSAAGGMRRQVVADYASGLTVLEAIKKRRVQHGYVLVREAGNPGQQPGEDAAGRGR